MKNALKRLIALCAISLSIAYVAEAIDVPPTCPPGPLTHCGEVEQDQITYHVFLCCKRTGATTQCKDYFADIPHCPPAIPGRINIRYELKGFTFCWWDEGGIYSPCES